MTPVTTPVAGGRTEAETRRGNYLLDKDRELLEQLLPGLDEALARVPFVELESPESPAIELFRTAGGPALLVPENLGGLGASPSTAIRIQRAVGARCPSLAVASTMHHFSVASLLVAAQDVAGFEWMLLEAIATERQLLASGFAEGKHGQGVFTPTLQGRRVGPEIVVNGSKKPCSLARSMDLLTASVFVPASDGEAEQFAVALVPADAAGIEVRPFWSAPVLRGAQSEEVVLQDVRVDADLVVPIGSSPTGVLDHVQTSGFLWFELLITASYLGMASALAEQLVVDERGTAEGRAATIIEIESGLAALDGIARSMAGGESTDGLLPRALACRYAAQDAIARSVSNALEQLGGMAFIRSSKVSYLAAACPALAFHPPSRGRTLPALEAAFEGEELRIR